MASKIQFKAYVPGTAVLKNPTNPLTDTGAIFDFIQDDAGVGLVFGSGAASPIYLSFGTTATVSQSIRAVQYVQVASVSTSGVTAAQAQAATGYIITRNDNRINYAGFTIPAAAGVSNAVDIGVGAEIVGISIHGAWS